MGPGSTDLESAEALLEIVGALIGENTVCWTWNPNSTKQASAMTVKAILTDMDGTITRFNLDYMWMRRVALQLLSEESLGRSSLNDQMSIYAMLKEIRGAISDDKLSEIKRRIYEKVETIETRAAEQAELMPGAKDALTELKQMKKKVVIITNNGRLGADRTIERLGLSGIFDGVITRDDVDELKPDPGIVLKALNLAGTEARDAILVGDAIIDIKAAKAASVRSVAVPTGPFPAKRLLEEEPDFIVSSFLDVPRLVHALDNST